MIQEEGSPVPQSSKLTHQNLRKLLKLYRAHSTTEDQCHDLVITTLCDVRVAHLFVDPGALIGDQLSKELSVEDVDDVDLTSSEKPIVENQNEDDDANEFTNGMVSRQVQNSCIVEFSLTTRLANESGRLDLSWSSSIQNSAKTNSHGLSRIFDPQNNSLLLLNTGCDPSILFHTTDVANVPCMPLQQIDKREHRRGYSPTASTSRYRARTKSRIPRPQSFRIPLLTKSTISKSKYDLRFPRMF